ncbi:MAG: hypothetical protein JWP57_4000 [Spirosoma sp.]|nr:hypothetical protein [Spirosoma sp.]
MKTTFNFILAMAAFVASSLVAQGQVKIGTNTTTINAGSVLELETTNKGLLMPRVNLTNTTTWGLAGTQAAGMHVYNTNAAITSTNTSYPTLAAFIGEYYWDGTGWVALAPLQKSTTINSFPQSSPGATVNIPSSSAPLCGFPVGGPVPVCAIDLNRNASFSITNAVNDVVVDVTGNYSVALNTSQVSFNVVLAIDKTTPGVYEVIDNLFVTHTGLICSASYLNFKSTLKNLPVRSYNIKIYLAPWVNGGAAAVVGVGKQSNAGVCGNNDFANQKVTVSVSQ